MLETLKFDSIFPPPPLFFGSKVTIKTHASSVNFEESAALLISSRITHEKVVSAAEFAS